MANFHVVLLANTGVQIGKFGGLLVTELSLVPISELLGLWREDARLLVARLPEKML